jgi:hypothetical protein
VLILAYTDLELAAYRRVLDASADVKAGTPGPA